MKYKIKIKILDTETLQESDLSFDTDTLADLIIPLGDLFESGALFTGTTANPSARPV
jgi:hypothetical protein